VGGVQCSAQRALVENLSSSSETHQIDAAACRLMVMLQID
jgi:hypothetical protein